MFEESSNGTSDCFQGASRHNVELMEDARSHLTLHEYISLEPDKKRLRLLRVLPGRPSDHVRCTLETHSLHDAPTYTALSYTWGRPDPQCEITLDGRRKAVRKNLLRFLSAIQSLPHYGATLFWIDALCINQDNNSERSYQVAMMADIYRGAEKVLIWLGPAHNDSVHGMKALTTMSQDTASRVWRQPAGSGIRRLCYRSYWSRLWVFQELALAKSVTLMCGRQQVSLSNLLPLLSIDNPSEKSEQQHFGQASCSRSPAATLAAQTARSIDSSSLYKRVLECSRLSCADTRDKVYGLLGTVNKGHEGLTPDYKKEITDVVHDVLRNEFEHRLPTTVEEMLRKMRRLCEVMSVSMEDLCKLDVESVGQAIGCNVTADTTKTRPMVFRVNRQDRVSPVVEPWTQVQPRKRRIEFESISPDTEISTDEEDEEDEEDEVDEVDEGDEEVQSRLTLWWAIDHRHVALFNLWNGNDVFSFASSATSEEDLETWCALSYAGSLDQLWNLSTSTRVRYSQSSIGSEVRDVHKIMLIDMMRLERSLEKAPQYFADNPMPTMLAQDDQQVLWDAVLHNRIRLLSLLLEHHNVDFTAMDDGGLGLLRHAFTKSTTACFMSLLRARGLTSTVLNAIWEEFSQQARRLSVGRNEIIVSLRAAQDVDLNVPDICGNTTLHYALSAVSRQKYYLNKDLVDQAVHNALSSRQLHKDAKNNYGETPLQFVVRDVEPQWRLRDDFFSILKDYDVNSQSRTGCTILHCVLRLPAHYDPKARLTIESFVKDLLDIPNIDVNIRNKVGETPLLAFRNSHAHSVYDSSPSTFDSRDILRRLIQQGADPADAEIEGSSQPLLKGLEGCEICGIRQFCSRCNDCVLIEHLLIDRQLEHNKENIACIRYELKPWLYPELAEPEHVGLVDDFAEPTIEESNRIGTVLPYLRLSAPNSTESMSSPFLAVDS